MAEELVLQHRQHFGSRALLASGQKDTMGQALKAWTPSNCNYNGRRCPDVAFLDQSKKALTILDRASTLIAVIMNTWLIARFVQRISRHPLKEVRADRQTILRSPCGVGATAVKAAGQITCFVFALEAGRDGLSRWLLARGVEAYFVPPTSIVVSRERRRATADRLDTSVSSGASSDGCGQPEHCRSVAVTTIEKENAKRSNREDELLVGLRTSIINRVGIISRGLAFALLSNSDHRPSWSVVTSERVGYHSMRLPRCVVGGFAAAG